MAKFGKVSMGRLDTCDPRLQHLFLVVVEKYDCVIICGHRNKEDQNKAFAEGKSKLKWPKGKHNKLPSQAVDAAPYISGNISWDAGEVRKFAKFVLETAKALGIKIRWGGDWDGNPTTKNNFDDLVHFELA